MSISEAISSSGLQYAKQVSAFAVPGSEIKTLTEVPGSFFQLST